MAWFTQTITSSLGKKYIMALTGLLLGCFLLIHAAGNSAILLGRTAFLSYAGHLHTFGFLVNIAELLLLAVLFTHMLTGLVLFIQNAGARTSRYANHKSAGGRSWGSATMPYTGVVILAFLVMHLINFRFAGQSISIADMVAKVLNNPIYTLLYGIGLAALTLHVSHGFWSMFQSAGVNHPKYDWFIRTCAWLACGLIMTVFFFIVLLLLANGNYLS